MNMSYLVAEVLRRGGVAGVVCAPPSALRAGGGATVGVCSWTLTARTKQHARWKVGVPVRVARASCVDAYEAARMCEKAVLAGDWAGIGCGDDVMALTAAMPACEGEDSSGLWVWRVDVTVRCEEARGE